MPLLEARGVTVRYGGVVALDGVDVHVDAGEIVGVIGPNGAGKSSLLDALSGVCPARGRVLLAGGDVSRLPPHRRVRRGLVRTFQSAALVESLTVRDGLLVAARAVHAVRRAGEPMVADVEDRVDAIAELVGVADRLDEPDATVGGHTRRLVDLAAAVVLRPRCLLLDEPAAGAGAPERVHLAALLQRCRDRLGLGVLLVEHDVRLVFDLADRVYVLDHGTVISTGAPDVVRHDPSVVAAYLGTGTTTQVLTA